MRDLRRQAYAPDEALATLQRRADRVRPPHDTHQRYRLHEPEVPCISKGKAHQRYEFGQKVAIATTNRGNWIVGAKLLPDSRHGLAWERGCSPSSWRVAGNGR